MLEPNEGDLEFEDVLENPGSWLPSINRLRREAFYLVRSGRYGREVFTRGTEVSEAIGMAVPLFLAAYYSTEQVPRRASFESTAGMFRHGFELRTFDDIEDFLNFNDLEYFIKGIDPDQARGSMRFLAKGGSLIVIPPPIVCEYKAHYGHTVKATCV